MAYSPTVWVDDVPPGSGTLIDAAKLNKIEQGIAAAGSIETLPASILDAKGDLIAASAADVAGRLPVGANGTIMTADNAQPLGVKWAAPAPGSLVKLFDTVLGADAPNVDITGISGAYAHLLCVWCARSSGATQADSVVVQLNGDTSVANYYDTIIQTNASGAVAGGGPETANGRWSIGLCPGASSEANAFGMGKFVIADYAATSHFRTFQAESSSMGGASNYYLRNVGGMWRNATNPITRVTVYMNVGPNLKAGSRVTLYGMT